MTPDLIDLARRAESWAGAAAAGLCLAVAVSAAVRKRRLAAAPG